ncbi:hypothetical protein I3843_11G028400 [Carya illinoinensis]|nr:hypothetical protein I3843_11G028400 [Carya illinoinensis]
MQNHLSACPRNPHKRGPLDRYQQTLAGEEVGESDSSVVKNLVTHKYSEDAVRLAIAEMVIIDELSFRIVEGQGFKKLVWLLEPRFKVPYRVTVARDCMKLFTSEKAKLRKLFKDWEMRVSLTTDTWTSIQNLNYMCLTAHFIDNDWKLKKKIINFCLIPNYRGDTIGKYIESCLLNWGIDKIFTVTVDNASSNDTAISYLKHFLTGNVLGGKYMHLRCCAHILNLVVNEGLKECNDAITMVRNAVRYVRSSPARLDKFKKCAEKEKIDCKKLLCLDVQTRWNSTYMMLDAAEKFEKAFRRMESEDYNFLSYFNEGHIGPPRADEWETVRVFVKFLKMFYDATCCFSGSLHVTANTSFVEICMLQKKLVRLSQSSNRCLMNMAISMRTKYDKYWGSLDKLNLLLLVAVVPNPRNKLGLLTRNLRKIYDETRVLHLVSSVRQLLFDLYDEYNATFSSTSSSREHVPISTSIPSIESEEESQLYMDWYEPDNEIESTAAKTEVDRYLSDGCEALSSSFDLLIWWRQNEVNYPILARIARDLLAMPVSTVASESAFSTGGRVFDQFRSSLAPKTVEALICTQNWLRHPSAPIDLREAMDNVENFVVESVEKAQNEQKKPSERGLKEAQKSGPNRPKPLNRPESVPAGSSPLNGRFSVGKVGWDSRRRSASVQPFTEPKIWGKIPNCPRTVVFPSFFVVPLLSRPSASLSSIVFLQFSIGDAISSPVPSRLLLTPLMLQLWCALLPWKRRKQQLALG